MKLASLYRLAVTALIALFLLVQGVSAAHAASYGDAPHEHDGVVCAVTVLSVDQDVVLPELAVIEPLPRTVPLPFAPPQSLASRLKPPCRAPPPRGPPSAF